MTADSGKESGDAKDSNKENESPQTQGNYNGNYSRFNNNKNNGGYNINQPYDWKGRNTLQTF